MNIYEANPDGSALAPLTFGSAYHASWAQLERERTPIVNKNYSAPEDNDRALNYVANPRGDSYSLGVILFELLTARLPYTGKTSDEIREQQRKKHIPNPREINPLVSVSLASIVMKALQSDPNNRYQSASEFKKAFEELMK